MLPNRVTAICVCALALMMCTASLRAEPVQYLEQQRFVTASTLVAEGGPFVQDTESESAPDFGPFDSQVTADALLPLAYGHGDATQISELANDRIIAFGAANAVVAADLTGAGAASGSSHLDVSFLLNEASGFTLDGLISFIEVDPDSEDIGVELMLSGDVQGVVVSELLTTTGLSVFSYGGVLEPDTYTLTAKVVAGVQGVDIHAARGAFDFELIIPEPATAMLFVIGALLLVPTRRR